jgi:hypothetical protein
MGFLFSKTPSAIPEFSGYQSQTALNTVPIPIIYGTPRVTVNIIYVSGFQAVPAGQNPGGAAGKGLISGGKGGTKSYNYFANVILAVGEGPMPNGPVVLMVDQNLYNISGYPDGLVYIPGLLSQTPWTYISTNFPNDARSYPLTAYLGGSQTPLDSTATIPQFNLVQPGLLQGTSPLYRANYTVANANAPPSPAEQVVTVNLDMDADPALVIVDFLTNADHGVQFPASLIDSSIYTTSNGLNSSIGDGALQTYCQAVGLAFSLVLNNAEQASNILSRWCDLLVVACVWTGATLKFIPYWDLYCAANPGYDPANEAAIPLRYYNPDITPIFSLTDDDFVQAESGEDPVTYERMDTADIYNTVRVDYKDRMNLWNDNVAESKNENDIELNGIRVDNLASAQEFSFSAYAQMSAQMKVNRNTSVRIKTTFKLSWEYCMLDPMDIVLITDANLGWNGFAVRIVSIEEDDKSELTVTAEEFPYGSHAAVTFPVQPSTSSQFNFNFTTNLVNTPVILEPTPQLLAFVGQSIPTLLVGLSAGPSGSYDPNFGGAQIFASLDNVTYSYQGTFNGVSTMGVLSSSLASYSGANPDNTNTIYVNLSESAGSLNTATSTQAAANQTLCALMNDSTGFVEYISFTTATLVGPNQYQLTGLYRGLFGTTGQSFGIGTQFLFLANEVWFQEPLPANFVGVPVYFKFCAFNRQNLALQPISDVTAYLYTATGAGTGPGSPSYPTYSVSVVTTNTNINL